MEKNLKFKIEESNWGMMGPGDWKNTEWCIYDDYSVVVKIEHNKENGIEEVKTVITTTDYDKLENLYTLAKENNKVASAFDGTAWEFIEYKDEKEVWKFEKGYIYGIEPLEDIEKIVKSLI